jgi:hypothetical protein
MGSSKSSERMSNIVDETVQLFDDLHNKYCVLKTENIALKKEIEQLHKSCRRIFFKFGIYILFDIV